MELRRDERIVVQKLLALLRVADALDRSHTQQIIISDLSIKKDSLIIRTSYSGDLSLEELSLSEKGDLFENVFGLKAVLRFGD